MWCPRFRHDINAYLATLGEGAPVATIGEVLEAGLFHPNVESRIRFFQQVEESPDEHEGCRRSLENRARFRRDVGAVMRDRDLDALAFPTWANPPRLIGDLNTPDGDNSQHIAPHTGFPAITVPMGQTRSGLPLGLQLVGDNFDEVTLIRLAHAYEQATRHRVPPASAPPLN